MPPELTSLPAQIAAVGALGTAATGLLDTLKTGPNGFIANIGFAFISATVKEFLPGVACPETKSVLSSLQSQWINGTTTDDQISIAKSLIKLHLDEQIAPALAAVTNVNATYLTSWARKAQANDPKDPISPEEQNAYARFDLVLSTRLDETYQRASQRYRNAMKALAVPVAIGLAFLGKYALGNLGLTWEKTLLIGLVATPIAPIAKNLSNAVQSAAQALKQFNAS